MRRRECRSLILTGMSNAFGTAIGAAAIVCCVVLPLGLFLGKAQASQLPLAQDRAAEVRMSGSLIASPDQELHFITSEPSGVAYLTRNGSVFKVDLRSMKILDELPIISTDVPFEVYHRREQASKANIAKYEAASKLRRDEQLAANQERLRKEAEVRNQQNQTYPPVGTNPGR